MQNVAAAKPLYVDCPHCGQTVQCFSNNGEVQLSAHHDKEHKGNCKGSHEVAKAPRTMR